MTGKLTAFLVTIAQIATALAGLLIVTTPDSLGLSSDALQIAAGWLALSGSAFTIVVVAIRRNLLPGVETGIAKEENPT